MAEQEHSHHEIDYIEISVTDRAEFRRFYVAAFDWMFTDYAPGYAGIRKRNGGEAGGLRVQADVAGGGPPVILYSPDLKTTLARVREVGGRITREISSFRAAADSTSGIRAAMNLQCGPIDDRRITIRTGPPPTAHSQLPTAYCPRTSPNNPRSAFCSRRDVSLRSE